MFHVDHVIPPCLRQLGKARAGCIGVAEGGLQRLAAHGRPGTAQTARQQVARDDIDDLGESPGSRQLLCRRLLSYDQQADIVPAPKLAQKVVGTDSDE